MIINSHGLLFPGRIFHKFMSDGGKVVYWAIFYGDNSFAKIVWDGKNMKKMDEESLNSKKITPWIKDEALQWTF